MRSSTGIRVGALVTALAAAAPAQAQVNYYTQGYFTSASSTCNAAAPMLGAPVNASCSGTGWMIDYTAVAPNAGPIASGSVVSLGGFNLTATGGATFTGTQLGFTLLVRQTQPTVGSGTFTGYITGNVTANGPTGDISTLKWTPNQFVNISPSTYEMIFDNIGYAAGSGLAIPINQGRGINALVTVSTVPEPSSVALMAAGLLGITLMARRSRMNRTA